jgi:hypothetical protein
MSLLDLISLASIASAGILATHTAYRYYKYANFACVVQDPKEAPGSWRKAIGFAPSSSTPFRYIMVVFDDGMDFVNPKALFTKKQVDSHIQEMKEKHGWVEVDLSKYAARYGVQDLNVRTVLFGHK